MSSKSKLRACMLCSFVQSALQFKKDGCPNCEDILNMRGRPERVLDCTTGTFDGTVALMDPSQSWVAKWQRINRYIPGLYAIRITGTLPEHIQVELENQGIPPQVRQRDDD
ncbi:Spt4/RpoE2 zinc finger-domain-containing protein [Phakopsora pachyrhizi]|uniref:Transcription elongation factor SPT4 n=1 Tax=Phakopsora pachyrhizi TaxID=170000 RepID=A0A0S1MJV3_PHAPC|nr:Spt4/RpoE2 zinc finger-domain-containing protein [Phakopsora pachyrhizi]CAH7669647.1 Spt4/RpoE2 zinc finger-domain-containing protein [Phakopsora pachyrhizi]